MRHFDNWLTEYVNWAGVSEAPKRMYFWSGVGAIAGALRRKVWIDMRRYCWYPSFYIIYVAKPGIVAKSTTADVAMNLLRQVPGIKFGANAITWQALVSAFEAAAETFEYNGLTYPMAPLSFVASELGSLVDLQNRDMVNLLIELWDGKKYYEKITKNSGNDLVEAPWINIQGCTTPHWIADNMPQAIVGGGLSSRCVYVFAEEKERYVAYVDEVVGRDDPEIEQKLVADLEQISNLVGPFVITEDARVWGRNWYETFWRAAAISMNSQMVDGYAARKQTHMHKLAMVLSVSRGDSLRIELEDLQLAEVMLNEIEEDMSKVFSQIGRTLESLTAERLGEFIKSRDLIGYEEAYRFVHLQFPDHRDFEGILQGLIRSGMVALQSNGQEMLLKWTH